MNISIIIPNYNGEELLKKNLPKVIASASNFESKRKQTVEIIVVDDFSTDNSIVVIKRKNLAYVKNKKNLGFSSSVNRGVDEAKGEIIVLLNTDVNPENDFLFPLLSHFEDENVFAVGCMDRSIEGEKTVLRGRGIGKWERGFLMHSRGEVDKGNTLWVSGGSGAFRKSIWEKLGGFNQLYNPFYWEDIDLSYRALKSDYAVLFEPKSIVVHEHKSGSIQSHYSAGKIKRIAYRNQFIFVWKNATDIRIIFTHILCLPYHMMFMFLKREWAFFYGFFDALFLLPKIMRYRTKEKKQYKKSDYEVTKIFTTAD